MCVSAIIRFVFLYNSIYRLTDFGKNQYSSVTSAFIWAEIEPNASVIAACLPTYGSLFKEGGIIFRIFDRLRPSLGASRGTAQKPKVSVHTNSEAVGYYELDKVFSTNKSNGDIHTTSANTDQISPVGPVHEHNNSEPNPRGMPKAWLP